ncbi:MAG: methyltransferase domain-containing protein [Bacteroidota bacterium]|nr:methyltransferase domain-containing protein [Bacteroidota bacterium]
MAWYKNWFDSEYYHLLYGKRDQTEADKFVENILKHISLEPHARLLDLACGNGRHSNSLAQNHFEVWGIDLSPNNILLAKNSLKNNAKFEVADMRIVFKHNYFDLILNLFTSFGYFHDKSDNLKTLESVKMGLKDKGLFIQDFMNSNLVVNQLIEKELIQIGGIDFHITRTIKDQTIIKEISFSDKGEAYNYAEEVALFTLNDFKKMYEMAGLEIINTYGDYSFNPFDEFMSPRLILISQKIA